MLTFCIRAITIHAPPVAIICGNSVGSVKGFALYLGLTTVCDVAVFWFVARPATFLLARTNWLRSEEAHRMAAAAPIGASS